MVFGLTNTPMFRTATTAAGVTDDDLMNEITRIWKWSTYQYDVNTHQKNRHVRTFLFQRLNVTPQEDF